MATITMMQPRYATSGPIERTISDALEAVARNYARGIVEHNAPSTRELLMALRQPVSMAAVLADVAQWLGVEPPAIVEDALR